MKYNNIIVLIKKMTLFVELGSRRKLLLLLSPSNNLQPLKSPLFWDKYVRD